MLNASKIVLVLTVVAAVIALTNDARAVLLYDESVPYTAGPDLTDLTGGNPPWSPDGAGGMTDDWNMGTGGSLTYPLLSSSGNLINYDQIDGASRTSVRRALPAAVGNAFSTEGQTIYMSWLIRDSVGMFFHDGAGNNINLSSDLQGGNVRYVLQIADEGPESEDTIGTVAPDGSTHLLIFRVLNQAGNDDIRAVLDPDLSLGEPDWSAAPSIITNRDITSNFNTHQLVMGNIDPVTLRGDVDEFKIFTDFNDIFPVIPEPATVSLFGMAGIGLLKRRRQA